MSTFDWTTASVGSPLPTLVRTPSTMQLFMFSAVTWNRHRIHYEKDFAVSDGLRDVAVHRSLLGAFLGQLLTEQTGVAARIRRLRFSVRGSAVLDQPLHCAGEVTGRRSEDGRELVECAVWIDDVTGARIVPGTATVELLSRAS